MTAKLSREIKVPFQIGADGGVAYVENEAALIRQRLVAIIRTRFQERVMLPTFGSNAHDFVFENNDPVTVAELAARLRSSIAEWEPNIVVTDIRDVSNPLRTDATAVLEILFSVPPREDTFSTLVQVGGVISEVQSG